MLKKLLPNLGFALALILIAFIVFQLYFFEISGTSLYYMESISDTVRYEKYSLNDTMPYRQYKKIKDSIEQEEYKRARINESSGGGWTAGFIGIRTIDDCSFSSNKVQKNNCTKYYLLLPNYRLSKNTEFVIGNGKNFIKYVIWDRSKSNPGRGDYARQGHYVYKPVRFRFSNNAGLLIPVTKKQYYLLYPLIVAISIIFLIFLLYIILALPVRVILKISLGMPFDKANIRALYLISFGLIAFPFIILLITFLLHLLFKNYFVSQVELDLSKAFTSHWVMLIIGVIVMLVARAFYKGYKLQEEQKLTI